jgi:hypothetical protein
MWFVICFGKLSTTLSNAIDVCCNARMITIWRTARYYIPLHDSAVYFLQYTLLIIRLAPFHEKPPIEASCWHSFIGKHVSLKVTDSPLARRGSAMRPAHAAVARHVRGLRPSCFAGNRVIALKFIHAFSDFYWPRAFGGATPFH